MEDLLKHQEESERRIFLLTLLKNGRVKADRIRAEDDPRLRSKTPFALITPNSVLPASVESNVASATERDSGRDAERLDEGYLPRPQIAESIENFRGLFHALRDATEDTILEIDRKGRLGPNGASAQIAPGLISDSAGFGWNAVWTVQMTGRENEIIRSGSIENYRSLLAFGRTNRR